MEVQYYSCLSHFVNSTYVLWSCYYYSLYRAVVSADIIVLLSIFSDLYIMFTCFICFMLLR